MPQTVYKFLDSDDQKVLLHTAETFLYICFSVFSLREGNAQNSSVQVESVEPVVKVPLCTVLENGTYCQSSSKEVPVNSENSASGECAKVIINVPKIQQVNKSNKNKVASTLNKQTVSSNKIQAKLNPVKKSSNPHVIRVLKAPKVLKATATVTMAGTESEPDVQTVPGTEIKLVPMEADFIPVQEVDAPCSMLSPQERLEPAVVIDRDEVVSTYQVEDMSSSNNSNDVEDSSNENVVVQHYLLTSIITNTPSGEQTSQLITTPIVLPASTEVTADNVATVPIQLIGNPVISNEEQPAIQTIKDSTPSNNFESVPVIETSQSESAQSALVNVTDNIVTKENKSKMGGAARCMPISQDSNSRDRVDKINITFAQQSDDSDSMQDESSHTMELVRVFESMIEDNNSDIMHGNSQPDPHCQDRCSDYTELVDTNKEYVLINPVSDDFQFQNDLDSSLHSVSNDAAAEDQDTILSIESSQDLTDALSSL